jgi:phosphoribosyl 1,2-cyclic phosphodiesterase
MVYNKFELEVNTMEITILGSGSKGNATYIKTKNTAFLIDAGLSYKQINERLRAREGSLLPLDAVFLTHEHSDHTKGLHQLIKQTNTPLWAVKDTYKAALSKKKTLPEVHTHQVFETHLPFEFKGVLFTPIRTSHDAAHAVGFVIEEDGKKLAYITDTGYLDERDFPKISNAHMYIFESNYDISMLYTSQRPHYLKQRIDSVRGHLSNTDSAYYLSRLVGDATTQIVLAHLSQDCNTEARALSTLQEVFDSYDVSLSRFEVHVAKQHTPTKTLIL